MMTDDDVIEAALSSVFVNHNGNALTASGRQSDDEKISNYRL